MDDKLIFSGGETGMNVNDFMRVQSANREFIQGMFEDFGECIVSGAACVAPGSGNDLVVTSDGFVYLDGYILKVDAGTYPAIGTNLYFHYVKQTTYEAGGDKTYADGTPRQTWQKNRAIPTSIGSVLPGMLDCVSGLRYNNVKTKILPTGIWDMDTDITRQINHRLSDHTKIRSISCIIISDSGDYYDLQRLNVTTGLMQGGIYNIDATHITLARLTGGYFDTTFFDDTSMIRGFITIIYEI